MSELTLAQLEARVVGLEKTTLSHDKIILGNGRKGLVQEMAQLSSAVENVQKASERMEANVSKLHDTTDKFITRMEVFSTRADMFSKIFSKQLEDLQADLRNLKSIVGPLVDWKKGIVMRLATMGATTAAIATTVWFILENKEKIGHILGFGK